TTTPPATIEPLPYADELRGAVFDPPRPIADFSFPSTTGANFTLSEHKGEIILIYFGYRSCPDFCPTTFAELKRVYDALDEPADRLKVVFVTVDPERDDLESLGLYTHAFQEDFIAVREDGTALQELMDEFGVVAEKRERSDSAMGYLIDHTASVFLIGPDGNLEVQYLYGTDYRDLVHDLRLMLDTI
ncbi:MAG: SCO family protein, partial [Anaerolineae bacterium]|nr:SCO family protein [Anaerolineae bacterium]